MVICTAPCSSAQHCAHLCSTAFVCTESCPAAHHIRLGGTAFFCTPLFLLAQHCVNLRSTVVVGAPCSSACPLTVHVCLPHAFLCLHITAPACMLSPHTLRRPPMLLARHAEAIRQRCTRRSWNRTWQAVGRPVLVCAPRSSAYRVPLYTAFVCAPCSDVQHRAHHCNRLHAPYVFDWVAPC